MVKILKWGSFLLVWGFSHSALAQGIPSVLSWEDCVRIAGENNAQILAAKAQLRSLDYLEDVTKSPFLPQISAYTSYNRSVVDNNVSVGTPTFNSSGTAFNAGLSASLNIFSGFGDVGRMWQAQANEQAGQANLRTVKAQVSYDLKNAFESFMYAKEYQKLTQQIIDRRKENLGLVELRYQGGRENKGSVLLSRAYLAQAEYDDLQAQNAQRVSRRALSRALGYDEAAEYDVTGNVPTSEPGTRPVFENIALMTPEYANIRAQEEAAEAAVIVARSSFYPTVDVTGRINEGDNSFFPEQTRTSTLGVNISVPLFVGGRNFNNSRSAVQLRSVAQQNRMNISRDLLRRLEQAYSSYIEGVMKLKVDSTFRDATTVRAEIARKKYNNGLQTFEDWDVIESDLINRQKTYLQSKRDRVILEAAWEQSQGKGALP